MKKILIVFPYYLPGYRAGGPLQTIKNIVEVFGEKCKFYILALNHDLGVKDRYDNIEEGWNQVGNAYVRYLSESEYNLKSIVEVAQKVDVVYACSLFSKYTILALLAKKIGKFSAKLVVAPMGVFSEGAIKQKYFKKQIFLKVFLYLGIFNDIKWSLSSVMEKKELESNIGTIRDYIIAEDLPRKIEYDFIARKKQIGRLKIIFLSRICPKKNLMQCLEILDRKWDGEIEFDIYGTKEDSAYWIQCEEMMEKLHSSVKCRYCGEVESQNVPTIFAQYDAFLFPTLGENFGHVIFEALAAGCVPIISDRTIWSDLEKEKCGIIIGLDDLDGFVESIGTFLNMPQEELEVISYNAMKYAKKKYEMNIRNSGYNELFL